MSETAHPIKRRLGSDGWLIVRDEASLCYGHGPTIDRAMAEYRRQLRELVEQCDGEVLGKRLADQVKAAKEQLASLEHKP